MPFRLWINLGRMVLLLSAGAVVGVMAELINGRLAWGEYLFVGCMMVLIPSDVVGAMILLLTATGKQLIRCPQCNTPGRYSWSIGRTTSRLECSNCGVYRAGARLFGLSGVEFEKPATGICGGCGYDLRGLRCPECGQAFDPAKSVAGESASDVASGPG